MAETRLNRMIYERSPVWVQNLMTTVYGWEKNRYRYGRADAAGWQRFYEQTATWSEERLRDYQLEQVKETIRYGYAHVPWYRAQFDQLGLKPDAIQTLKDIKLLPYLTKDQIREAGQGLVSDEYEVGRLNCAPTSGSTGMPMRIYSDRDSAVRNFVYRWAQCRPGLVRNVDRYASFTGLELVNPGCDRPPFWRMNHASRQRVYSVFHLSDRNMPSYLEDLARFNPVWIYGYPSALYTLADFAIRKGWRIPVAPKIVITSSEQCLPEYRQAIEEAFQAKVWDEYGQVEMGGVAFGCECGKLHEKIDFSLMEFVPVREEDGLQVCELICTSFINKAMPLIRYRVGDLALIRPGAICTHGRPGRVIEQIYGRTAQFIICADGSRVSNISVMAKKCRNVKSMQAVQEEVGRVTLRVVRQPEFDRGRDEAIIEKEFRKKLGDESRMRIQIEYVESIELTKSGKFLSIVNRIK
jgi:phenylacetate-CoA ligase